MIRRTTLALVALAAFAPQLRAQEIKDFWTQCTPGLLRACASTSIWNEVAGTDETFLVARISNVQGTPGFSDLPLAGLIGFSINNLTLDTEGPEVPPRADSFDSGQFGELSGNARWCPFSLTDCETSGPGVGDYPWLTMTGDGIWQLMLAIHPGGGGQTVWGCDIPDAAQINISTCGGEITWRIRPSAMFATTTFALRPTQETSISYHYVAQDWSASASCTTGIDCVTVTPEPATILLMASGLLAVVGVSRRRRRLL